jgi:DNA-binding NarL/FixJ family response regulator
MIRIVLADDQALVRAGFRLILDAEPDLDVVGEAVDGATAVAVVRETQPDVVLLDVRMPNVDGLTAARQLLAHSHPPKIIMLTTFDVDEYVTNALLAGASGYLLKDVEPADLITAVRAACAGDLPLAPAVTRRLVEHYVNRAQARAPDPKLAQLSPREREILGALGRGLTNAEIVAELHLSLSTVKTHVAAVFTKLGLRDRVQAAIAAHQLGVLDQST